jgi:hypothetical protein
MEQPLKQYRIVDAETETSVAIVEASSAKQAVARFSTVQSAISLQRRPGKLWQCIEHGPDEPRGEVPVFMEAFFQALTALGSVKH